MVIYACFGFQTFIPLQSLGHRSDKAVRDSFLDENCPLSTFIKIMSA
jgi:hypothetical protein